MNNSVVFVELPARFWFTNENDNTVQIKTFKTFA